VAESGNKLGPDSFLSIELAAHVIEGSGQFIEFIAAPEADRLLRRIKGNPPQPSSEGFERRENGPGNKPDTETTDENAHTETDEAISRIYPTCLGQFLQGKFNLLLILLLSPADRFHPLG